MGYPATSIAVRFARKFEPELNTGCWLWTDAPDRYGYGRLQVGSAATLKAHRVSYELHHGPIPAGFMVCHRCDTPACVNPAHLFAAPAAVNVADMIAKGRRRDGGRPNPGEDNGRAVLSEADAIGLLLRQARGERISPSAEAQARGVSRSTLDRLLNGRSWRHLPRAEAALIARHGMRQLARGSDLPDVKEVA